MKPKAPKQRFQGRNDKAKARKDQGPKEVKVGRYYKAEKEYKKKVYEAEQKKKEEEEKQQQQETALKKYGQKKRLQYKKLAVKNYKGQPNMGCQMKALLSAIEKQVGYQEKS